MWDLSSSYEVSWLAEFFHGFPHIDLAFASVNSTANFEDPRYREVSYDCYQLIV